LHPRSDNVPRLHDFTNRFTPRFCELMHDVDEEVAAAGLQLLALLVEHGIISHKVGSLFRCLLTCSHGSGKLSSHYRSQPAQGALLWALFLSCLLRKYKLELLCP
jgi:hypothetical protein